MADAIKEQQFYTPAELARMLGVSKITISRHIRAGALRAIRIGGQWRLFGADVAKYVQDRMQTETFD